MDKNDSVAVVIPVYCASFLADALQSVFLQSRPADEVIVVDDGSPDRDALRRTLARFDGRVSTICQPNQGAGAARNAGITATAARFVAFLDADDSWFPDFLHEQMLAFQANPALDVVCSDGVFTGETPRAGRTLMSAAPSHAPVTLEALLAQRCHVHLSATVARRSALIRAGLFDPSLWRGQDFDLWLRMAKNGAVFGYQRKVLMVRRIHDRNLSGTSVNQLERALYVLRKTLTTMDLTAAERSAAELRIKTLTAELSREQGKHSLCLGDFEGARRALREANRELRTWKLTAAAIGLRVAPRMLRNMYRRRLDSIPPSDRSSSPGLAATAMSDRGRRLSSLLPYLAPMILVILALHQMYAAHSRELTSWKGGGFGMCATIDRPRCRVLRAYMQTDSGELPIRLGDVSDLRRRSLDLAVAEPSTERLRRVATELRQRSWVVQDGPADSTLSFEGGCSTVAPSAAPPGRPQTRRQLYPPALPSTQSGELLAGGPIRIEVLRVHFDSSTRRVHLSRLAQLKDDQ